MDIKEILTRLSGLFDTFYVFMDDEERETVNEVEDALYAFLQEKGHI